MRSVYLDNAATSFPKPECVYTVIESFMRANGASPGRGNYARAMEADQKLYEARRAIARLFGIGKVGQVTFTSNVTTALNLALKGFLNEGDAVLTSNIEHNAMWRPLKALEKSRDIKIVQFHCAPDGSVDLQEIAELLRQDVKLVAFLHASNVLGNLLPVSEISKLAHENGVSVLVDSAQTAGAYPIDVERDGIDLLAFTGHKSLMGATGTGGLYIREGLVLETLVEGGTGSMAKSPYQPSSVPDRFEAGTVNMFGIAGLHAATEFIRETGVNTIREHEAKLVTEMLSGLNEIEHIKVYGSLSMDNRVGLVSFNIEGADPYEVARRLDEEYGIMVRAGLHCSPQAHKLLGTEDTGTLRASVGYFNTDEDIEQLLSAVTKLAEKYGGI